MADLTLVFDAGGTLLVVNPNASGPMARWPQLEPVPGVKEMLAALNGRHRLVIGSNAADSDAALLRAAMKRLDLDGYFSACFTPAELDGARKPDRAYFLALEQYLGTSSADMVMVGDGYEGDVTGAVRAGWRAVWYNPAGKAAADLTPLHNAEIVRMSNLPGILGNMSLPSVSQAFAWLDEQKASPNLLRHVQIVAGLAYQMAVWLRNAGEPVDPVLAHRGGLLHDLAKGPAREQKVDHGWLAAQMLVKRGQPELAKIAGRHVLFHLIQDDHRPQSWEEKLVYYADKLVEAGKIVNFQQRLAAMQERYKHPTPEGEMERLISALSALEADICRRLQWTPEQLLEELRLAYSRKT